MPTMRHQITLPTFAIALQYWDGDREKAMATARLMAAMEGGIRNQNVAFFLVRRRDAQAPDEETIKRLKAAFHIVVDIAGIRFGKGHPSGCNDLWFDTMTAVEAATKSGLGPLSKVRAVFTCEADCVPLKQSWTNDLFQEWLMKQPALGMGFLMLPPHSNPHLNGNAVWDPKFISRTGIIGCPVDSSWDIWIFDRIKKYAAASENIWSWWRCETITKEQLFGPFSYGKHPHHPLSEKEIKPAVFHGVRDWSAHRHIVQRFGFDLGMKIPSGSA